MRWLVRLIRGTIKRLVLRSSGYTRPPFMLWVHPQRQPWGCNRLFDRIPISGIEHYAMYLWPDRLRWGFFFVWLCFIPIFFGVLATSGWSLAASISVVILVIIAVVVPFVLFDIFRTPVLSSNWKNWPAYQEKWLEGIPQLGTMGKNSIFFKYLSQFTERWDSVYWSPTGSPQESMLRAAIIDLLKKFPTDEMSLSIWHGHAFRRWLKYWCSPVWAGYAMLWLLLIPFFLLRQGEIPYAKKSLIASAILWTVYTVVFIYRESSDLNRWIKLKPNDYRFLPPHFYKEIRELSGLVEKFTQMHVMAAFGLAQAAASGFYISIVQILLK